MKYSIEEMNLMCIYLADTRCETIANLQDAFSEVSEYSGVCVRTVRSEGNRRIND